MIGNIQPQDAFRDVPVVRIRVSWADGKPIADPESQPVNTHNHEPTVIIWRAGQQVQSIEDITFEDGGEEFTVPVGVGPSDAKKVWVSIDLCSTDAPYKYSITAVPKGGGGPVTTDPMIVNQDRA